MPVLLAFLSGVSFGVGDFLGGLATRREGSSPTVVLWAHITSLGVLAIAVWLFPRDVALGDVVWGAAAGLAGAAGLILLYRGLAVGTMSIVAPITAVGAAIVPVAYGLVIGDSPVPLAAVGSAVALGGVWVVSADGVGGGRRGMPGLAEAVASGLGFGLFFILISNTGEQTGMVPLVSARVMSIAMLAVVVKSVRGTLVLGRSAAPATAAAGVLDITANALFLVSARAGSLPIAAVLSSLYPAMTVVLAWGVLGERIDRVRTMGLIAVGIGVALIALSGT